VTVNEKVTGYPEVFPSSVIAGPTSVDAEVTTSPLTSAGVADGVGLGLGVGDGVTLGVTFGVAFGVVFGISIGIETGVTIGVTLGVAFGIVAGGVFCCVVVCPCFGNTGKLPAPRVKLRFKPRRLAGLFSNCGAVIVETFEYAMDVTASVFCPAVPLCCR
jgi:hypothetical protein